MTSDPTPKNNLSDTPTLQNNWNKQRENIQIVAIALIFSILLRIFVAEPRFIPSDSMIPTLTIGDRLLIEKISYHFSPPKLGDIIVFEPPLALQEQGFTKEQVFIKRIMGTPGHTIGVKNGQVYLDGQAIQEDYIDYPPDYEWGPEKVPEKQYFVMGDNRSNSRDSHVWGFLPEENIIGRAVFRFWPFSKFGLL